MKLPDITAYYNPETDSIENCQAHSFEWWHEAGHRSLHMINPHGMKWLMLCLLPALTYCGILGCILEMYSFGRISNGFFVLTAASQLIFMLFDEGYAWAYCFIHWSDWR
jgi:hypothetical protein